ncbi:MAG: thiamine pyrophosphate-binding protein, partial [Spirochaetales bacterium]|nr:thiamine pyrophosphate-binding protein [Spirochaetales bacterium]
PFFLLLPMNVQGKVMEKMNLMELPVPPRLPSAVPADMESCRDAVKLIEKYSRITVKSGGGARNIDTQILTRFLELSGAVYVHGPQVPGLIPSGHDRNMTVGGSKGSISGNYAMENCDLLIVIGARGVCQWDSSGTAWKKTREIININTRLEDALHYNRTLPLVGDAAEVLKQLNSILENQSRIENPDSELWLKECQTKRSEWDDFIDKRKSNPLLYDEKWERKILTQPGAIMCVVDFAVKKNAVKIFDAGDVQANGFQIVQDDFPGKTYNETGASYMGFAVSALLASGMADKPDYSIAYTGDGSFLMTPQILLDAVNFGVKGMIVLFDNRKMAAISNLQEAQYGRMFATDDNVEVDYIRLASSFKGVSAFDGGYSISELNLALESAYAHDGLSLVYVSVYSGPDEMGGLGVYGSWNVGNWCDGVQKEKHRIGL